MKSILQYRGFAIAAALLLSSGFAAGCDDDEGTLAPAPADGQVRVAHLSPDAGNVDIWVDGARVLENVPFRATSDYLALAPGDYRVQVAEAGNASNIALDQVVTVPAGALVTAAAIGTVANSDLALTIYDDSLSNDGLGNCIVRFIHASPDAPAVDVVVADGGPTLFDAAMYPMEYDYIEVAAGSYDLEVRLDSSGTLALPLDGITLMEDTRYTVYAVGLAGDSSLSAEIVADPR